MKLFFTILFFALSMAAQAGTSTCEEFRGTFHNHDDELREFTAKTGITAFQVFQKGDKFYLQLFIEGQENELLISKNAEGYRGESELMYHDGLKSVGPLVTEVQLRTHLDSSMAQMHLYFLDGFSIESEKILVETNCNNFKNNLEN